MTTKIVFQADEWLRRKVRVYRYGVALFVVLDIFVLLQVKDLGMLLIFACASAIGLLTIGILLWAWSVRERERLKNAPQRTELCFFSDELNVGAALLHGWAEKYVKQKQIDALMIPIAQISLVTVYPGGHQGAPNVPDSYEITLKSSYHFDPPLWTALQSSNTLLINRRFFYGRERDIIGAFERCGIPIELRDRLR